jgi:hypothetical protein
MMDLENQPPLSEDEKVVEDVDAVALPPPLPEEKMPQADNISDETRETLSTPEAQSGAVIARETAETQDVAEPSETEIAAAAQPANKVESIEDKFESKPTEETAGFAPATEGEATTSEPEGESEIAGVDAVGPESAPESSIETAVRSKPDLEENENQMPSDFDVKDKPIEQDEAQAESASSDTRLLAEPEVVDITGDEAGESETLGEDIVELVETEASQKESQLQPAPETLQSSDTPVEEAKAGSAEERRAENDVKRTEDAKEGLIPDLSEDTVILDVAAEIKKPDGEKTDQAEKATDGEAGAEALSIEKAAQDMAAAIKKQKAALAEAEKKKKQKAALANAQALKKQKAALAKARAIKKQKMILAKAAALKRKKAAQAKAQALKKQEAAQASVELASTEPIAAAQAPAGIKGEDAHIMQTGTKMHALLEKYKGQAIGINYDNSAEIRKAQLTEANGDYFSVFVEDKKLHYSYPLKSILTVIEGEDGVDTGDSEKKDKFNAVIKVYPLVLF